MAERPATQIWTGRLTYVALVCLIAFFQLMPLREVPSAWTGPDLLLAITFAVLMRRPEYVPFALIAVVFLLADLLFQRPPGLWAALVCIFSEMLRVRVRGMRNVPLLMEWGTVSLTIVALAVGYRLALFVSVVPQAPLGLTLVQVVMTIAVYPLVVGLARVVFGLSRPAPGQTDSFGHRL